MIRSSFLPVDMLPVYLAAVHAVFGSGGGTHPLFLERPAATVVTAVERGTVVDFAAYRRERITQDRKF